MARGTTNANIRVSSDTRPARRAFNRLRNTSGNVTRNILGDWRGAAAGIVGVGTATQAASRFLSDYDTSTRNLVAGTGARGERLGRLRDAYTDLISAVPVDADTGSQVIANLDTAFEGFEQRDPGAFRRAAIGLADLDHALGQGTSARLLSAARAFGVAETELSGFADVFLGLDQSTTGDTSRFLRDIERYTPVLEAYTRSGFEALEFVSTLTNENIRFSNVQTGLSRVTQTAADQNRDATDVLAEYVANIEAASTDQEKMNLATEYFSGTAAPGFVDAIEAGAFALRDQNELLSEYEGQVQETADTITGFVSLAKQSFNALSGEVSEDVGRIFASAESGLQRHGFSLDDVAAGIGGSIYGTIRGGGPTNLGGLVGSVAGFASSFRRSRDLRQGVNVTVINNGPVGQDAGQQIAEDMVREVERTGYTP